MQWIPCVKLASNFLFRLSVRHVGRMNTQVWLLNSLARCVSPGQNRSRNYSWKFLARTAECLELKLVSAVMWISLSIKFAVKKEWPSRPFRGLQWLASYCKRYNRVVGQIMVWIFLLLLERSMRRRRGFWKIETPLNHLRLQTLHCLVYRVEIQQGTIGNQRSRSLV